MILRPYQTTAVDAVLRYFEAGHPGHPMIVMPTGTGKSLVIAALIQRVLSAYPTVRVLMLTHVKELISQDLDKLTRIWPDAPVGVYSAGLGQNDTESPILFCGIQSVWNKAKALSSEERPVELIFIDEAHRVPLHQEGTYRRFIADLTAINPHLRLIGLTATPYRHVPATKTATAGYQSLVHGEDRLFTDIAYDLTRDMIPLIEQDYLAALWPQPMEYQVNLTGMKIQNGDYQTDQLNELMSREEVIDAILAEAIPKAQRDNRRHWLVFCAGVDAARNTAEKLRARGISAGVVTGDTPDRERGRIIHDFRAGQLTALVSVSVLTTGFDAPVTDCMIVARPTISPVLWVQMCGRGMRPTPEKCALEGERKRGCLVLDFVGNTQRHGPIDRLTLKTPGPKKPEPMKTCPECEAEINVFANPCPECGHVFEPTDEQPKAAKSPKSSKDAIIAGITPLPPPTRYEVTRVAYSRYVGKSGIPTLRVDYFSGFLRIASEWVCLGHPPVSYPRRKAEQWWKFRQQTGAGGAPDGVQQAVDLIKNSHVTLRKPVAIHVLNNPATKFQDIVKHEWEEEPQGDCPGNMEGFLAQARAGRVDGGPVREHAQC